MKKVVLQSMTDFVIEQNLLLHAKAISTIEFNNRVVKFANFLRQKLELWMFVPCELVDGKWVPLEEPAFRYKSNDDRWGTSIETDEWKEYRKANERVLFEGFEYKCHREVFNSELGLTICFNTNSFQVDGSLGVGGGYFINNTVEFFTNMGMVLTTAALKQLGLVNDKVE